MEKNIIKADIAVIGGGASGICGAIAAKQQNRSLKVVILEKLPRVGKKILVSGNGRCNLGNKNISSEYFHGTIKNYMDIIKNTDTEEFFKSLGLLCNCDSEGRMYPYSNHASSVLNVLRIKIKSLGIEEICDFEVKSAEKINGLFEIKSADTTVYAKSVIISAGGYSSPSSGTDGAVTELMKKLGHKVTDISPSLAPMQYKNSKPCKQLAGIRAYGRAELYSGKRFLGCETGEIQFTETALSGICIFNLSGLCANKNELSVKIDFMPERTYQEVSDFLFSLKKTFRECMIEEFLTGIFRKNLGIYLVKNASGKNSSDGVSELTSSDIKSIAAAIKSTVFEVKAPSDFKASQVTCGGIHGSSVDENLQSKHIKGLYFSGEILDLDGKCGGYNLTWAWASGLWAGKHCAENLR